MVLAAIISEPRVWLVGGRVQHTTMRRLHPKDRCSSHIGAGFHSQFREADESGFRRNNECRMHATRNAEYHRWFASYGGVCKQSKLCIHLVPQLSLVTCCQCTQMCRLAGGRQQVPRHTPPGSSKPYRQYPSSTCHTGSTQVTYMQYTAARTQAVQQLSTQAVPPGWAHTGLTVTKINREHRLLVYACCGRLAILQFAM